MSVTFVGSKGLFCPFTKLVAVKETTHLRGALDISLEDIEPVAFRERLHALLEDVSLTPGVLTIQTAHALEPSITAEAAAQRGAGVQLSYEGMRLTRSIIRDEQWEVPGKRESYYLDLLACSVLVARGFHYLADTSVADQSVEIVRRFGRNQTYEQQNEFERREDSLEVDIVKLAVNAGADMAMQTIPPSITSYGDSLAREIGTEPLPEPEEALTGVEERVVSLAQTRGR